MSKYKGPLFLPKTDTVFKLVYPLRCMIDYNGSHEFTDDYVQSLGLSLIKSSGENLLDWNNNVVGIDAEESIFEIPIDSRFKVKFERHYDYATNKSSKYLTLQFTTTLNRQGPIKGGFSVHPDDISSQLEVEEI